MSARIALVVGFVVMACGPVDMRSTQPNTNSTALVCSRAEDCPAFFCSCADGTRWDTARFCLNTRCQDAAATCQNSCRNNGGVAGGLSSVGGGSSGTGGGSSGTGGGSSGTGGGSSVGSTCSAATTCPAFSCTCGDGSFINSAQYCLNRVCQGQSATCADACKGRSTPTMVGCELRRFSSEFSVTAVMYGAASTELSALSQADDQCAAASWTSTFCAGAAEYCASEPAVPYSCTFSKYASSSGSTVRFVGRGTGQTAAKRAAVAACLASGAWRGWFCSSGTLSCAAL